MSTKPIIILATLDSKELVILTNYDVDLKGRINK